MRDNMGLYHGKRVDNGEWVEGYFVAVNSKCYIGQEVTENTKSVSCLNGTRYGFYNFYEVIPDTVGQHTGLTDKNGKKIFEGDIIQSLKSSVTGFVQWFPEHSAFMVWCKSANEVGFLYECADIIKVIGNIHDNG